MNDSARDIVIETRATLQAHLDDCSRQRQAIKDDLDELKVMLEATAEESRKGRRELHRRLDKVLWGLLAAVGSALMAAASFLLKILLHGPA